MTSISNAVITLAVFTRGHRRVPGLGRASAVAVGDCCCFLATRPRSLLIVVGFSLGSSVLFLRYRDLNQVWDLMVQAGFFLAPIIYPLGILPERFHFYLYLWPPTPSSSSRGRCWSTGTVPTLTAHLYLAGAVVLCLGAGMLIYRRYAPRAAEYL